MSTRFGSQDNLTPQKIERRVSLRQFNWRSYDLNSYLHAGWRGEVLLVAESAVQKILKPRSVTSREGNPDLRLPVLTVNGVVVKERLPWLYELYNGHFRELAQEGTSEQVVTAEFDIHAVTLNVQRGVGMRYECHVDSNPLEALLYATDHPKGSGGELVVANSSTSNSVEEVDANASIIYPVAGNLVFFDARRLAHYVRPLASDDAIRVVVTMNYYTPSCTEADRPGDLDKHLFGYED